MFTHQSVLNESDGFVMSEERYLTDGYRENVMLQTYIVTVCEYSAVYKTISLYIYLMLK